MPTIDEIRHLLEHDRLHEAVATSSAIIATGHLSRKQLATAYYLRGNAYRRNGDTRLAINDYLTSIDLDPDGPATHAYRMAQDVLNFYDHDLYNP